MLACGAAGAAAGADFSAGAGGGGASSARGTSSATTGLGFAGFVARLDKIGVDAVCSTPEQFAQAIRDDLRLWKDAAAAAGMKAP